MMYRIIAIALVLFSVALAPTTVSAAQNTCNISDLVSLHSCFSHVRDYDVFAFTGDLRCTSEGDCCPGGHAPMLFQSVSGKEIDGNGHSFRREAGQHACPAIVILKASHITMKDLVLDEDAKVPPCDFSERDCPNTIKTASSRDIRLDAIRVYAGKGYVVSVWATDGFTFTRSTISDAGIIGLSVGHYKFGPSRNITITDSVFARTRTNAIALQGAYSSDPAHPVLVANNVLVDNHWHGVFPVPGVPGGVTTGGQLFVGDGENIRVTGNIIAGHPCDNCYRAHHVTGIEIVDMLPAPAGVHGLQIDHNLIIGTNESSSAMNQHPNPLVSDVAISDNRVIGYDLLDTGTANASHARNSVRAAPLAPLPAAAALARSPQPGAPATPVFLCARKATATQHFTSTAKDCGGDGEIVGVLGFPAATN